MSTVITSSFSEGATSSTITEAISSAAAVNVIATGKWSCSVTSGTVVDLTSSVISIGPTLLVSEERISSNSSAPNLLTSGTSVRKCRRKIVGSPLNTID